MSEIKDFVLEYLNKYHDLDEYDINHTLLGMFMDSLEILDFVIEIEKKYEFDMDDDWAQWEDYTVDDVVIYIKKKLNK